MSVCTREWDFFSFVWHFSLLLFFLPFLSSFWVDILSPQTLFICICMLFLSLAVLIPLPLFPRRFTLSDFLVFFLSPFFGFCLSFLSLQFPFFLLTLFFVFFFSSQILSLQSISLCIFLLFCFSLSLDNFRYFFFLIRFASFCFLCLVN